ncbi:ABC transporter permease [Candidatus Woesearchaeota archaeon]|nr:ABC transporter permease [Candidatus Woesearchaeota archaeon]
MSNLLTLIQKNFRLLLRARMSSLIVILGPLLVIFLIGVAFDNSNLFKVNIGAYAEDYNPLVQSFLDNLEKNHFTVTKFVSEEDCIEAIKTGVAHLCISFSEDFELSQGAQNHITFYADFSRVNLVYNVLDATSSTISLTSSDLSLNLTTQLLDTLDQVKDLMKAKRGILIGMTTHNDQIYQRLDQLTTTLQGADVSVDRSLFNTGNLSDQEAKVDFLMRKIDGMFFETLNQSRSLIENLRQQLSESAISESDKENLTSILSEAEVNLNLLDQQMDLLMGSTKKDVNELGVQAITLINNLNNASTKIKSAVGAQSNAIENVNYMRFTVDKSLNSIIEMQNAINTIENTINQIKVTDPATIVHPITTTVKPVTSDRSRLNYIFPSLLILLAMFTSILLVATLIQMEKGSSASFRNFMSPVRDITFILSTFCTALLVLMLQLTVILIVAGLFFSTQILFTIFDTWVILFFISALFTSLGMVIGYLFRSQETASLASISAGAIFLFLSDVILPLEAVPSFVRVITHYNPFVIGVNLLRRSILFQTRIFNMGTDVLLLIIYAVVLFLAVILVHSLMKRSSVDLALTQHQNKGP